MIRVCAWLLMFFGTALLFSPVLYLIKWIPLIGWGLTHIASFIVWLFSFVFSVTFTALTIGLAWLYYRPLYGVVMLSIVACGIGLMFLETVPATAATTA